MLNQCWFNFGPPTTKLDQRLTDIGSTSCVSAVKRVRFYRCVISIPRIFSQRSTSKQDALIQYWLNVGRASTTVAQHQTSVGSASRVCCAASSRSRLLCGVYQTLARRRANVFDVCPTPRCRLTARGAGLRTSLIRGQLRRVGRRQNRPPVRTWSGALLPDIKIR